MNVTPATHIPVGSNGECFGNPAGRILLLRGFELLGRAVSVCADMLFVQREYVGPGPLR